MAAIVKNYGIGDACKMAVNAGVDTLAICADPNAIREGHDAVLAAVEAGEITQDRMNESLERIARVKAKIPEPAAFDTARLARISDEVAEFNTELGK
jgi:beta-N-acetylhexosaminidase